MLSLNPASCLLLFALREGLEAGGECPVWAPHWRCVEWSGRGVGRGEPVWDWVSKAAIRGTLDKPSVSKRMRT